MAKLTGEEIQDIFDIIQPDKVLDTGNSGKWIYGYCIEWLEINSLHEDTVRNLCEYFNIEFVGKTEEQCEKLRERGIPEKTAYEFSENFPKKEGYWYDPYGFEISEEDFDDEIANIEKLVKVSEDMLIKKSLILSALIFTESFVNLKIRDKIEVLNIINENDSRLVQLREKSVDKNLWREKVRVETFKLLFDGENFGKIPYTDIRDSLAHNIREASIDLENNTIYYRTKNGEKAVKVITKVFEDLKGFAERLNKI